jgi:Protein of unknown function (DUF3891)
MFRSARRDVVYPQAEHARFSAAIAAAWGNDRFPQPPLPFESFVRGVALHDRGYGELDADGIGELPPDRWLDIQRRGFEPRDEDPVVDLVVALHVRRLVGYSRNAGESGAAAEMEASLPNLLARAGVSAEDAARADRITNLCDRIAFDFCVEEPADGAVDVEGGRVEYRIDGAGGVTLDPWPLALPHLVGVVAAYRAAGYPTRPDPVVALYRSEPAD